MKTDTTIDLAGAQAVKHTNGRWLGYYNGRLILRALFERKKSAMAFASEHAAKPFSSFAEAMESAKRHGAVFHE